MVLIGVFVTHVVSGFSILEAVNGVLTERLVTYIRMQSRIRLISGQPNRQGLSSAGAMRLANRCRHSGMY